MGTCSSSSSSSGSSRVRSMPHQDINGSGVMRHGHQAVMTGSLGNPFAGNVTCSFVDQVAIIQAETSILHSAINSHAVHSQQHPPSHSPRVRFPPMHIRLVVVNCEVQCRLVLRHWQKQTQEHVHIVGSTRPHRTSLVLQDQTIEGGPGDCCLTNSCMTHLVYTLSTEGAVVNRFLDYRFSLIVGRVLDNFLTASGANRAG